MDDKESYKSGEAFKLMLELDIEKAEWLEYYEDDIVIVRNPTFKFHSKEPYKISHVVAVLCEGGEASGAVNLRPCHLLKNSFLIVLSGHIMESYGTSPDFKGTYVFMSESFLSRLDIGDSYKFYENVEKEPLRQLNERTAEAMMSYMYMSKSMLQLKDINPNTGEAIRLLTKLFFLMMGWFVHGDALTSQSQERDSETMEGFIKLVKRHYTEHRDVEFYAEKMNMTAKYMSTLVKKASGKSALKWIEDYVILDAKARLASSMDSIQKICYDLNFPTQSFFGRYFKRAVGMSPSEYRRSARLIK